MIFLYDLFLFILIIINFFSVLIIDSYSQQLEVTISNPPPWKEYIIAISTVGAVVLGAIITNFLGPHIKEKFQLREVYIVPYKKWCTSLYGEIHEFQLISNILFPPEENHNEKTIIENNLFNKKISDAYLITHFWEIHKTIATGHNWLGKIKTDTNKNIFRRIFRRDQKTNRQNCLYTLFKEFINYVDFSWHDFENTFPRLIETDFEEINFRIKLGELINENKNTSKDILNKMSNLIKYKYFKKSPFDNNKLEKMKKYLEKQIA